MPSLILTGFPSVGKSKLAELLAKRALEHSSNSIKNVVIINEESAVPTSTKMECYSNSTSEKMTRGALKTEFDKALQQNSHNGKTLVILDSLNYIKGYRYELHCISKAAGEKHGVVWLICNDKNATDRIKELNNSKPVESHKFTDDMIEQLMLRYETPDERNRWDKPLYRVDTINCKLIDKATQNVLDNSLYNMHDLRSDLASDSLTSEPSNVGTVDLNNKNGNSDNTSTKINNKKPTKSNFKRAGGSSSGFKRAIKPKDKTAIQLQLSQKQTLAVHKGPQNNEVPKKQEKEMEENGTTEKTSMTQVVDSILDSFLCNIQPLKEGFSTRSCSSANANMLHQIDSITQKMITALLQAQDQSVGNGKLVISLPDGASFTMDVNRRLPMAEVRRLRRQYIQWTTTHPPTNTTEVDVSKAFLTYVKTNL